MMLYKNTKVKVCSQDEGTDSFDIVASVLQGDTLVPYLFIICLDYMLRTSIGLIKDNSFKLTKRRNRRYPAQTITDALYADDIVAQAKSQLHSLEQVVGGIGLHVNADKTEYMCFNQRGDIYTLSSGPRKLVNRFT